MYIHVRVFLQLPLLQEKIRLPKGALWMAPQTCDNLQAVAMAAAVMCVTKPSRMELWTRGHNRCTEIRRMASL